MSLWQWLVGILIVLGILAYANPQFVDDVKYKLVQLGSITKTELENNCLNEINRYLDIMRKKAGSRANIELIEYNTFHSKDEALEYSKLWGIAGSSGRAIHDINDIREEQPTIFIGVFRGESPVFDMFISLTAPIVCYNNTILPNSKQHLVIP